ncbi:MAG: hypothetical protein N2B03_07440, partial [Boseongicola sp.]
SGNVEDLVLGASTRTRMDEDDNLQWHFDGEIENLLLLDRPLEEIEILFLSENGNDLDALNPIYGLPAEESEDTGGEETGKEETGGEEETGSEGETGAEEEQEEEPPADTGGAGGIGAFLDALFSIIFSIFGGGGNDAPPPAPEDVEEKIDELATLLSDLLPPRGSMDDDEPSAVEEEEMLEAML